MSGNFEMPIVDMAKANSHREELGRTVVNALENTGFLFLENVPGVDFDKLYSCCRWFFHQPEDVKKGLLRKFWNPENPNIYRGYFPVGKDEPSRKEGFEFGRDIEADDPEVAPGNWFYEQSVWPSEDGTFLFKRFMLDLYEVMHQLSLNILRLTSIGLGIDEYSFDDIFMKRPCSTFRLIHYPPWEGKPPANARIEDGKVVTTPDHTDSNFLTLLTTFNYKGLEVLTGEDQWAEIVPRPGSLVMNIGDVFSRMMGGRFKATRHRVIDIGVDRFSVPFFLEPSFDGDIGLNFMTKTTGVGEEHKVEKYGPWALYQMKHLKNYFEYRIMPEID